MNFYMPKIKSEILRLFLEKNLTTAEIADKLGYDKRRNKYDIVDKPLKELVNEGLINKSRVKVGRGRPPTLYSFRKELVTVLKAYESFPELRDDLRSKEWVRRLVLEEKFKTEAGSEVFEDGSKSKFKAKANEKAKN